MATSSELKITRLWQHGLYLWENEGAYLEAMEVFDEALMTAPPLADILQPPFDDDFDSSGLSKEPMLPTIQHDSSDEGNNSRYQYLAPLLLFMAGCPRF